jgi:serine/threonine-protein kinase
VTFGKAVGLHHVFSRTSRIPELLPVGRGALLPRVPSDGFKLGKYEIRGVIGRGAMSIVYDGWDPQISRRVAIKSVQPADRFGEEATEGLVRFRREAQAVGRLSHPNIVSIYDYGENNDTAYIVMEFVDGNSLKALLDAKGRLPIEETVRIAEELLAGLQFSHDCGVIHRDIKPANVMMSTDGRVKIADFGIARVGSSDMTQVGAMLGTPAYMSPEQFMGQIVDSRTDIYSSGVMLYRMLTGKRPFEGTATEIMQKVINAGPPRPSDLSTGASPGFDAVIARAMARRPADRFVSAVEFAHVLRKAFEATMPGQENSMAGRGDGADATVPSRPPRTVCNIATTSPSNVPPKRVPINRRRNKSAIAIALGGALVAILAAGIGVRFSLQPTRTESSATVVPQVPGKFVVFFPAWSAALDDRAQAKILAAARWAERHPAERLTVVGFAAPDGTPEANVSLSTVRAQLVIDQLARDGVAPMRMRLIAHGPVDVTDSLIEGRRVEIDIAGP